ncbi:MAG: RNAase, partial [Planctomycetota bacterium]
MIDLDRYVVKEKVGLLKASNRYEMLDPDTGEVVFACFEPRLGMFTKMFRMTDYKRYTPFDVEVATPAGEKVVRVKRGVAVLASTVQIYDERDEPIGHFKQKMFTIVRE